MPATSSGWGIGQKSPLMKSNGPSCTSWVRTYSCRSSHRAEAAAALRSTSTVWVMIDPVKPDVAAATWGKTAPATLPARPLPTVAAASPKELTGAVGPAGTLEGRPAGGFDGVCGVSDFSIDSRTDSLGA